MHRVSRGRDLVGTACARVATCLLLLTLPLLLLLLTLLTLPLLLLMMMTLGGWWAGR